jgi:tRNA pseudouridine38-40 synthase
LNAEEQKNEPEDASSATKQQRWVLELSFWGNRYSGWQVQPNSLTVQGVINEALKKLLRHDIVSMGCGRTDTGVHAKQFFMHFDSDAIPDTEKLLFRLNALLPSDIAVQKIWKARNNANTRFDALRRTYEYFIHFHKNPFLNKFSWFQGYYSIDWENIENASEVLPLVNDFTTLCLPSQDFKTNICHISLVKWDVIDSPEKVLKPFDENTWYPPLASLKKSHFGVRFTITANRFLRGMVRTVVGTLLMVGKKKISVQEFKDTVLEKKKFRMQYTAPPHGLYLSQVVYPDGYPIV